MEKEIVTVGSVAELLDEAVAHIHKSSGGLPDLANSPNHDPAFDRDCSEHVIPGCALLCDGQR